MAWLLLLGFFLLVFSFVIFLAYKLASYLRYRTAVRTWLVTFYVELFILFWIPSHVYLPGLPTVYNHGGGDYLLEFTTEPDKLLPALLRGQKPEELLLLLLPMVPTLVVLLYTRRSHTPAA